MRYFVVAFLLMFLAACSASGPLYTEGVHSEAVPTDKSRVFVYRRKEAQLSGVSAPIFDNGEPVGTVDTGGYITYLTQPGTHYIRTKTNSRDEPTTFDMEAGETYYIRLFIVGNIFNAGFQAAPMLNSAAIPEISKTRYQKAVEK